MRTFLAAIVCLSLTSLAGAQGSTATQHAKTEASAQQSVVKQPTAVIETSMGNITCTLFPDKAPMTVANFIGLANGTKDWTDPKTSKKMHGVPLYDNTVFHRVIPDFMIQGGDPTGTGMGDPGYKFKDEFSRDLTFDQPGRLAMANAGPGTNGSQFFITEVPTPHLNNHHTIFGQCQDLDVVKKIARVPRNGADKPDTPVVIKHIKIIPAGNASKATSMHKSTTSTKKSEAPSQ